MFLKKVTISMCCVLLTMGLLVGEGGATDDVIKWRVTTSESSGVLRHEILKYFAEAVKKASGGKLVLDLYPGGALYSVFDSLDSVKMGVTEATITWGDYWVGKEPMLQLLTYRPCDPFKEFGEANYLLTKYEPLLSETYSDLGVVYAGSALMCDEVFHSNVKIDSIEDFKGLRVRSSGLGQELLQALGASIITIPPPEVYSAMQLGTLDAFEAGGFATNLRYGYQEVTKYTIYPPIHCPGGILGSHVVVNKKAWEKLSDNLKEVVKYCAEAARLASWTQIKVANIEARKKFEESGNIVYSLPEDVMAEARKVGTAILLKHRHKSPRSKQFIDIYRETLKELGYMELAAMFEE